MKKKGPRQIPDFSTRRSSAPTTSVTPPKAAETRMPQRTQAVKPQATSAKSGRRGQ